MESYNLVSLAGIGVLLFFAWLCSTDRKRVNFRLVLAGVGLQLIIAAFLFLLPTGRRVFLFLNDMVVRLLGSAAAGTEFVFGRLALPPGTTNSQGETSLGFFLAFQGLPTVIFFASLMAVLYYLGIMQRVIRLFARLFTRLFRTSGAETLSVSSNIFVGVESALTIKPYLDGMTRSELCTVLAGGMSTIASSVMALYVFMLQPTFPTIAGHLISASFIAAPGALIMSKLLLPESGTPQTLGIAVEAHFEREASFMEAIIAGAMSGVRLVVGITALLLALLGFVALVDVLLGGISGLAKDWFQWNLELSLRVIAGYVFYPFTLVIGVPLSDAATISEIIGERIVVTEVQSYQDLASALAAGKLQHPRSAVVAAYALCGFAHFASLAIFVGGVSAIAPSRTKDLAAVGLRALLAASLATLLTGAVAGTVYTGATLIGLSE